MSQVAAVGSAEARGVVRSKGLADVQVLRWAVAAPWSVATVGLSIALGSPQWSVNDDAVMAAMASGGYTGSPESVLVFVNRLLGGVLAGLYTVLPSVPWYAVAVVGTLWLSFLALAGLCSNRLQIAMWFAVATLPLVMGTLRPSFTTSAVVAAASGLALVVTAMRSEGQRLSLVVGLVLVGLGALWRFEAAVLAFVFSAPLIAAQLDRSEKWTGWRLWGLRWAPGLAALVVLLVGYALDHTCLFMSDCSGWKGFFEYNTVRAFNEDPRGFALPTFAGLWGWTPAALALFTTYAYPDHAIFGLDAMRTAYETIPGLLRLNGPTVSDHLVNTAGSFRGFGLYLGSLAVAWVAGVLLAARRRHVVFWGSVLVAIWFAAVAMVAMKRLPAPLMVACVFALGVLVFALLSLSPWAPAPPRLLRLGAVGLVSLSCVLAVIPLLMDGGSQVSSLVAANRSTRASEDELVRKYDRLTQGRPAFSTAYFPGCSQSPFFPGPFEVGERPQRGPLASGWPVFSPAFEGRKQALGIGDVYQDLWDGAGQGFGSEGLLFVGTEDQARNTAEVMDFQLGYSPRLTPVPIGRLCGDSAHPSATDVLVWSFAKSQ